MSVSACMCVNVFTIRCTCRLFQVMSGGGSSTRANQQQGWPTAVVANLAPTLATKGDRPTVQPRMRHERRHASLPRQHLTSGPRELDTTRIGLRRGVGGTARSPLRVLLSSGSRCSAPCRSACPSRPRARSRQRRCRTRPRSAAHPCSVH